ncbi:MAG: T9SS type A sorting domain-containing protein [Bacteroidales bacterium]
MKTLFTTCVLLFSFIAVQAQVIEVTGLGVHNQNNVILDIPDPATIDHVVVEAIYKSKVDFTNPQLQVKFYDNDDNFFADVVPVEVDLNYSSIQDDFLGYAQATFPGTNIGPEGITLDQLGTLGSIHSFIAYIFRTVPNPYYYSVSDFNHVYMFYNGPANAYVYNIPIGTDMDPRDVTAKVVLSEMTADQRRCIIQVSDGYQTEEVTINTFDPMLGEALNIVPITLMGVPGDVTNITVTVYSPINDFSPTRGDSFITGAVTVNVDYEEDPPGDYCTLTQGFYGNAGGTFNGYSTYDLLAMLLSEPLVIGHASGYRFIAHTPGCILQRLPGGGPAAMLTADGLNCEANGFLTHKDGRSKNILLNQTITLGLNLRLDTDLGDLALADLPFGDYPYFINHLGANATIGDLYDEANLVLSGSNQYGLDLGMLADGVGKINDYFDECQPLYEDKSGLAAQNLIAEDYAEIVIYPNPVASQATIEFTALNADYTTVEIYNMLGSKVQTLYQGYTNAGETNYTYLNASGLNKGVYIVVMKNGNFVKREKINVN